jgi:hypothetical protein
MKTITCHHDTASRIMIHEIGDRVKIVVNFEAETVKFFKDGKVYRETSADISLSEFERMLEQTEKEVLQLNGITE